MTRDAAAACTDELGAGAGAGTAPLGSKSLGCLWPDKEDEDGVGTLNADFEGAVVIIAEPGCLPSRGDTDDIVVADDTATLPLS